MGVITATATLGITVNTITDTGTEATERIMADTPISLRAIDILPDTIIGIGLISPITDTGGHINDLRTFGGATRGFEVIRFSLTEGTAVRSGIGFFRTSL
ncbi:MAG: hypothetical protein GTN81_01440 [Proteobacteria bacterium]|nr:hypothetical protein [Pseudomonadota bacterium]